MKTRTRTLIASLCILASSSAMANDAVWGALLGGGAGAAIGGSVNGRNGAIVGGALGAAAGADDVCGAATDNEIAHHAADDLHRRRHGAEPEIVAVVVAIQPLASVTV